MPLPTFENSHQTTFTEDEVRAIRAEMTRMLDAERFRNSRRFPLLLRYLVEETLEGRGEQLKERSIGISIFGCPADYDTAENPIVRVTVAEVRKRIAQYYQEEGSEAKLRIDLRPGHYQPRFYNFPEKDSASNQESAEKSKTQHSESSAEKEAGHQQVLSTTSRRLQWILRISAIALSVAILSFAGFQLWVKLHPSALDEFWAPFLADSRTVQFCLPLGNDNGEQTATEAGIMIPDSTLPIVQASPAPSKNTSTASTHTFSFQNYEILGQPLVFSDIVAVIRISNYLAAHHRDSTLRLAPATTLEDLRAGPVVLIGAIDNPWTLHALAPLPYRFAGNAQERYWIYDREHPNNKVWGVDIRQKLSEVKHDYAILARVYDESTGKVEVIVAGIGMSGTAMAAQFAVDPQQMNLLRKRIGPAYRDHSFEVVLSSDVVNASAGSPHVEAVAVW